VVQVSLLIAHVARNAPRTLKAIRAVRAAARERDLTAAISRLHALTPG